MLHTKNARLGYSQVKIVAHGLLYEEHSAVFEIRLSNLLV